MRALTFLILIGVVVSVYFFALRLPHGAPELEKGTLAFVAKEKHDKQSQWNLYTLAVPNGKLRRLAKAVEAKGPCWILGGGALVFLARRELRSHIWVPHLWQISIDGTGLKELTPGEESIGDFSCEAKGTKVAYTTFSTPRSLVVLDVPSSTRQTIFQGMVFSPAWSSAEPKIAFISGNCPDTEPCDLYSIRVDGTARNILSRTADLYRRPIWSPEGDALVYGSREKSGTSLRVIRMSDHSERGLFPSQPNAPLWYSWAPNGKALAYSTFGAGFFADRGISILDLTGGTDTLVAPSLSRDVSWSHQGLIAFSAMGDPTSVFPKACFWRCDSYKIFVLKRPDKKIRALTHSFKNIVIGQWGP